MAPSDSPRADGRRLEGGRDGPNSRGPHQPVAGDAPAMVAEPLLAVSGSRSEAKPRKGRSRKPKSGAGHKTPPTRVPKGNPLRRAQALHRLRSRRPRHPSHPRRHRQRGWWHWQRVQEGVPVRSDEERPGRRRASSSAAFLAAPHPSPLAARPRDRRGSLILVDGPRASGEREAPRRDTPRRGRCAAPGTPL
jgi:hypothetical protein